MKFDKTINEAEIGSLQPQKPGEQKTQIDLDDLNNPALKNILNRIEQTKKRHAQELMALEKQLEMVKMKNNKKQPGPGVPGL